VLHTAAARGDRVLAGFAAAPAAGRADKAAAAEPPDEDEPSNTAALSLWPVERILVRDRKRKDLGDLKPLAESIAALGLLHPIVVRPDGTLIAGARRLAACRDVLGLAEVPVRVLDIEALVRGEADENGAWSALSLASSAAWITARAGLPVTRRGLRCGRRPAY
jgi:hypothetical protein